MPELCKYFLDSPRLNREKAFAILSFYRLEASAELGCTVCSILYNAEWAPRSRDRKNLPMSQKIRDLANPPDHLRWMIQRSEETTSFSDQRFTPCPRKRY
jgi:hypothetical protein